MLDAQSAIIFAIAAALCVVVLGLPRARKLRKFPLPPGPKGLPIVGNLFQVPPKHLATYLRDVCRKHSGFCSLQWGSDTIIVVGNMTLARELLEKRATKYSNRPPNLLWERYVDPTRRLYAFHSKNDAHRIGRRLLAPIMSEVRRGGTEPVQECEALSVVQCLLDDPSRWYWHLYKELLSTSVALHYGVQVHSLEDPLMDKWLSYLDRFRTICDPAASICNLIPALDLLPGPMPWRRLAQKFVAVNEAFHDPLAEQAVHDGALTGIDVWVKRFVPPYSTEGDQRDLLRQSNPAAIETTAGTLHAFILACVVQPGWIKDIQTRIDAVVGEKRMPRFSDRKQLPTVDAVVREVLRWRPNLRASLPHVAAQDDVVVYQGKEYFIPAGSIVFAPPWAIEHDPEEYPDPDAFRPARFLTDEGQLGPSYQTSTFGFGHRECPGPPLAERALWITIGMILWLFDVNRVEGYEYTADDSIFGPTIVCPVLPFPVKFHPRSEQRIQVARQEWAEQEKDLAVLLPIK